MFPIYLLPMQRMLQGRRFLTRIDYSLRHRAYSWWERRISARHTLSRRERESTLLGWAYVDDSDEGVYLLGGTSVEYSDVYTLRDINMG